MEPNRDQHHSPGPSLWPFGFALGAACLLLGLVLSSWIVAAVGAAIGLVSAGLWIRDATRAYSAAPEPEPERRGQAPGEPAPAEAGGPVAEGEEVVRYPRSVFLEGTTLGLGAVIGGLVAVPALGFMVAPAFVNQHPDPVDLGPMSNFPEGEYTIATFLLDTTQGEVTRRTAFVRNNGVVDGEPSFTIVSNRCVHLGCPVQPNGPVFDNRKKQARAGHVTIIPMVPAGGFGCPCHGGQYDKEGNRTAGPPVRALDRYEFEIRNGNLILLGTFSVAYVTGEGAAAVIQKYTLAGPGQHVDGPEGLLYPIQPPH